MTRLISEHFKRDGQPKRPYDRERAQRLAMKNKQQHYRCKFCGAWHLATPHKAKRG